MRRLALLMTLLAAVSLSTAFAASVDVSADNLSSTRTSVSISVPSTTAPPPLATGTFYIIGAPTAGQLVTAEPTATGGNEKGNFVFQSANIRTENAPPEPGDKVHYAAWTTGTIAAGVRFEAQTVRVHFFRTSGTGTLTAGLFSCQVGAIQATVESTVAPACTLIGNVTGSSATEQIDIGPLTGQVAPGHELRLKMVNLTTVGASIQWGYKAQNRPARLVVLP